MSAGKVVLGAMIGMAIGAVLGVLFAPAKGVTTRKQLSKKGSQYVGTIKDTAGEYVNAIGDGIESARETAVDLGDRVKGAVDSLVGAEPSKHTRRT
jgi:gas vesicle protein